MGALAAPAALRESGVITPRQAARRPGARCASGRGAGVCRAALPARACHAPAAGRGHSAARAVRLAGRGTSCFALRTGAAHPDPCVGQAPGETLADSAQMSIARSLVYGVANLLHPRMLWLMLWPMLLALAIWGTVAIALWLRVATLIAGVLQRWLEAAMFFANFNLGDATLIAAAILGWGNQRLLRYDALAEHADRAEMARIFRERRAGLYLLGLQLALLAYVPVLGFIAPVVFALAFIHYLLGALQAARRQD